VKTDRRNDLVRLLREGRATNQEELAAALREAGHRVTQATVSRDLRAIGATKVMIGGEMVYLLPDQIPRAPGGDLMVRSLMRTIEEFAVDIEPASSLVVVTTAPGHASAVARAVDLAGLNEVVGTVAGDDTIFVATPGAKEARALARAWKEARGPTGSPIAEVGEDTAALRRSRRGKER
jgi:transcriptional regulator of arginine metabolism